MAMACGHRLSLIVFFIETFVGLFQAKEFEAPIPSAFRPGGIFWGRIYSRRNWLGKPLKRLSDLQIKTPATNPENQTPSSTDK